MWFSPWRRILRGRSGDAKPSGLRAGTKFVEEDTGVEYTYDPVMKDWKKKVAPYSAIVCKDGSTVWAEDASGKTIASGESGVDDTSVIQSAIDSLDSRGGNVFVKGGEYYIITTINWKNSVHLIGERGLHRWEDLETTFIEKGADPLVKIDLPEKAVGDGGSIENINFSSLDADGNPKRTNTCILTQRNANLILRNLYFRGFAPAIDICGSWELIMENISIAYCGSNTISEPAIHIRDYGEGIYSNNISIHRLMGGKHEYAAILIEGDSNVVLMSNIRLEDGEGIHLKISSSSVEGIMLKNFALSGGTPYAIETSGKLLLSNGLLYGVRADTSLIHVAWPCGVNITNVDFRYAQKYAVFNESFVTIENSPFWNCYGGVYNKNRADIVGCMFSKIGPNPAIKHEAVGEGGRIIGNRFDASSSDFGSLNKIIELVDAENIIISGNTFDGKNIDGVDGVVESGSSNNNIVYGCIFWGFKGTPIIRVGADTILFKNSGYLTENSGVATFSGDGVATVFEIGAHGLVTTDPSKIAVKITPASSDAIAASPCVGYVDPVDNTKIKVKFSSAPASGANNVKIVWYAEVIS